MGRASPYQGGPSHFSLSVVAEVPAEMGTRYTRPDYRRANGSGANTMDTGRHFEQETLDGGALQADGGSRRSTSSIGPCWNHSSRSPLGQGGRAHLPVRSERNRELSAGGRKPEAGALGVPGTPAGRRIARAAAHTGRAREGPRAG